MRKLLNFLLWPWHKWQEKQYIKQRLKEMRERDPFIYK
jgi:hypothetical protein